MYYGLYSGLKSKRIQTLRPRKEMEKVVVENLEFWLWSKSFESFWCLHVGPKYSLLMAASAHLVKNCTLLGSCFTVNQHKMQSRQRFYDGNKEPNSTRTRSLKTGLVFVVLTSPFLSCQGFGLTRSSLSGRTGGPSSSLTLDEEEESDRGTGELAGHSAGRIMLAGIRAPTTASLRKHTTQHNVSRQQ